MRKTILAFLVCSAASPLCAQETPLVSLQNGDDSRAWQAVGRLNLGDKGFCTGALIAPDLVLTAAHCLFDKTSGAQIDPATIEFLAGWRNGAAKAYRGARRAVAHPDYVYEGTKGAGRVPFDLALIELDRPIRLPSVQPFATGPSPASGDPVEVVSYAQDRAEAPSLQEVCHVLKQDSQMLVLTCSVDFGSSGAPILVVRDGVPQIVSVVSAKAELKGEPVSLGTTLEAPLVALRAALAQGAPGSGATHGPARRLTGAKFVTAPPPAP